MRRRKAGSHGDGVARDHKTVQPRLSGRDLLRLGALGLTTRRLRTALSALGIAIGIAALVAVMGMSAASKADLLAQLDSLGTNMLRVSPGQALSGKEATLPETAPGMVRRIPTVEAVAAAYGTEAHVYRNHAIPEGNTGGLKVMGADLSLLQTLRASLAEGRWLDAATSKYPAVVLGSKAAKRLAITDLKQPVNVWISGRWFAVVGILRPSPLAPELDTAALIGNSVARGLSPVDAASGERRLQPATVYVRTENAAVEQTRSILARTARPSNPSEVAVSRPSEALTAQAAADKSLTALSLGLGAVGLLVGGVGIANVMVLSVMERRREIGVRRSLGATRGAIRSQFLLESVLLALLGGASGALLGTAASVVFGIVQGWALTIAWPAITVGLVASLVIGAIAGWYPAARAARTPPTEALRAT